MGTAARYDNNLGDKAARQSLGSRCRSPSPSPAAALAHTASQPARPRRAAAGDRARPDSSRATQRAGPSWDADRQKERAAETGYKDELLAGRDLRRRAQSAGAVGKSGGGSWQRDSFSDCV